jgi:hypothetical protein
VLAEISQHPRHDAFGQIPHRRRDCAGLGGAEIAGTPEARKFHEA